jgi:Tfp pilus assembly protein PilX
LSLHAANRRNAQGGAALAVSLLVLALLMMLGLSAMVSNITQGRMANNYESGVQAFNLAEAGIAEAMTGLAAGGAANGYTDELTTNGGTTLTANLGAGSYTVQAIDNDDGDSNPNADADGRIRLRAVGTVRGARRAVEVLLGLTTGTPPAPVRLAWRQVTP